MDFEDLFYVKICHWLTVIVYPDNKSNLNPLNYSYQPVLQTNKEGF